MTLYQLNDSYGDNICLVSYDNNSSHSEEEIEAILKDAYEEHLETEEDIENFLPEGFERVFTTEIIV